MQHRTISKSLLLGALGLVAAASPVGGFQRFDFDQRYFIQPGFIVKDHTLVEAHDGTFHLFYIKADETLPEKDRAKALGHASSLDLKHWAFHPDVIPVVPNTWEESFVWAPHIVQAYNVYFMYYTGVNRKYSQAIGLAVSDDLFNWIKAPNNPVYKPSTDWASWTDSTWSNCRDPYVVQDGPLWYLTTTAHTKANPYVRGAVSLASSPDLVHWTDLGPLMVHPGPNAWHVLESSNLHHHNGMWHLFMTEQDVGGSTYMSAPALTGPWSYASRLPLDAGHATEVFKLRGTWMLSRHTTFTMGGVPRYTIKFDDLDWNTSGKPLVRYTDPLADWTVWSGDAFYLQPTFWDNSLARGGEPSNFGGNSWIGTHELFTGPLQVGFPGLTVGDEPVGRLRSKPFVLTGNRLSFRIGGGDDLERLYMALYTSADGVLRLRATGTGSDAMSSVEWDVTPWMGASVFLEIADEASGPWGHVNVDEIVESYAEPVDAPAPAARFALHQNVPNPFNPRTRIRFEVPAAGRARLAVFDVRGRLVQGLLDAKLPAGPFEVSWDGTTASGQRAPSGVYYYRLQLGERTPLVRSMVLLK
jgi:hypothetical protein